MTRDVAAVLPLLEAEVPVWNSDGAIRLAGRVDALILREGRVLGVLDWKSALKPSPEIKSHYVSRSTHTWRSLAQWPVRWCS